MAGTNNAANYQTTQHNTLVGAANNLITNVSTGTTGQVLTSNGASSDPTYQNAVNLTSSNGYFYLNTAVTNVTGDGTTYTILYDTTRFQNGSDISYNSGTGVFTINTTGIYYFCWFISVGNLGSGHTQLLANLAFPFSGPSFYANPYAMSNQTTNLQACYGASAAISISSTNTFKAIVQVSGSSKTVTASGNTGSSTFNDTNYLTYVRLS